MEPILSFCRKIPLTEDQSQFFANAYAALHHCGKADSLKAAVQNYLADNSKKLPDVTAELSPLADAAGIHPFTLDALFVMLAFIEIHARYIEKYGEDVYRDSINDIANKIRECTKCEGVIGITAVSWYHLFLRETIFALGRLQFHVVPFHKEDCEVNGRIIKNGDPVIKLHIPSSGKLTDELCFDAYRRAYRFFKDHFEGDVIPFMCVSWMLYERNREFFPKDGNLARFMSDFNIVSNTENPENADLWRVFDKRYTDFTQLPRDNRLRAAMADYLLAGNSMGYGLGIFFHDGKEIVK